MGVPQHLARLWRLAPQERRGRPARLSLDLVVSHAVDLADSGGLQAVTIPKVAKSAGCSTMALYRHVSSKDELLILMTDYAAGAAPSISAGPTWREGLQVWAEALYAVVRDHPWIPHVPINGPPSGPGHISWVDAALRTLRGTALGPTDKVAAITLVSGYVHQAVRLATDHAHGMGADQLQDYATYGAALAQLVDPHRFPDAAEVFTSPDFAPHAVDDYDFHFGLTLILDGIENLAADPGLHP